MEDLSAEINREAARLHEWWPMSGRQGSGKPALSPDLGPTNRTCAISPDVTIPARATSL
jgi:hypothetical protein